MGKTLQVRDVPGDLHRVLKERAAQSGRSLSEYVLEELREHARRPTVAEMAARLASRPPVKLKTAPSVLVRRDRDAR